LVAKAAHLLQLLWYAWYIPKFRTSHLVQIIFTLIPSIIFCRLFRTNDLHETVEIFALGIGLDIMGKYIAGILVSIFGADGSNKLHLFIPALEIGHVIERTTAFYVLVAGEILISVSYVATESQIGIKGEWVRSSLGVVLAFWLCWVRFKVAIVQLSLISCLSSTLMPTPAGFSVMHYAVTGSHPSLGHRLALSCVQQLISHKLVASPSFMCQYSYRSCSSS
jgi:hypothetical protein